MRVSDRAGERPDQQPDDVARLDRESVGATDGLSGSFERVFLHHWHVVYAVLFRLVGTREEAEDLAQEVFLRLHRKPPRGEGDANVGGWLYRVATNLGYNALRGRRRREARELGAVDHGAPALPLDEVLAAEERDEVRAALADLSERQQACLVLRHQGLSYAEIAEALGVSPSSVGTILARAEAEFRRRYLERRGGM